MASALKKWKRMREEHGIGPSEPSPKREQGSSPETDKRVIGQKYVNEVKATFKDDAESYQKFLKLIHDVRLKQVDHAGVIRHIMELFKDHKSLILGFNMFLPDDEQISLPSTEPPEDLTKQPGIMFRRKVEDLGESKYKEFCEILALYKKKSNTIDHVYKLAETLFGDRNDLLADFRTFLPTLQGSKRTAMPPQEPDQQPAQARRHSRQVKFARLSANVRENEGSFKSSRRAEIASKGKEKMETSNLKKVAEKLKEMTSTGKEEARTKPTQTHETFWTYAHNATRKQQVQTAPRHAAAAGSPRPASDQRVSARTPARRQLQDAKTPRAPPPPASDQRVSARTPARRQLQDAKTPRAPPRPLPSIAELQERLKRVTTKCRPDCQACEHVEYPVFDWQAEDPEYYAKGKANRERERQALIAKGVPGSFNDS